MFGPSKQDYKETIAALQHQVQQLEESRQGVQNWVQRLEAENRDKEGQIKTQLNENVALSMELDRCRRELESLRTNLARVTSAGSPFLTFGPWRIRIARIDEIQADEEGLVKAINRTELSRLTGSGLGSEVRIRADDLDRLITAHYRRDEN